MLSDALGQKLSIGDTIGTVTGGQNAMVISGTVEAIHEVKITIKVSSCEFVGEPVGRYHRGKVEVGASKQLNAYRVFRLGPCEHERDENPFALDEKDLRFEVNRPAAPNQPVTVRVTHVPTGCSHAESHMSGLQAKSDALTVLARIVAVHRGPQR